MVGCNDGHRSRKCFSSQEEGSGQEGAIDLFSPSIGFDECFTSAENLFSVAELFSTNFRCTYSCRKSSLDLERNTCIERETGGGWGVLDCGKIS